MEEDPATPSSINRMIPKDIEAIILKSMDKNREKRYQSVTQFKDDIGRHLAGQQVLANKHSLFNRLLRYLKKKRSKITAIAVALVITITFFMLMYKNPDTAGSSASALYKNAVALHERAKSMSRTRENSDLHRLFEAAISKLDMSIGEDASYARGYILKGEILYRMGYFEEAIKELDQAEKLSPDSGEIYYLRAISRFLSGHNELYSVFPTLKGSRYNKRIELIRQDIHKHERLNIVPGKQLVLNGLLNALEGALPDAISAFGRAADTNNSLSDAHFLKSQMSLRLAKSTRNKNDHDNYVETCERSLKRGLRKDPNNFFANKTAAVLYEMTGKYERALISVDIIKGLRPDYITVHALESKILAKKGEKEKAREILIKTEGKENHMTSDAQRYIFLYTRATVWLELEEMERASEDFDKSLEMVPIEAQDLARDHIENLKKEASKR